MFGQARRRGRTPAPVGGRARPGARVGEEILSREVTYVVVLARGHFLYTSLQEAAVPSGGIPPLTKNVKDGAPQDARFLSVSRGAHSRAGPPAVTSQLHSLTSVLGI